MSKGNRLQDIIDKREGDRFECVQSSYLWWTVGRTYKFEDGALTDDEGDTNRIPDVLFVKVPKYPNPPHKHVKEIHAWADGARIERQDSNIGCWHIDTLPSWNDLFTYRIKPEVESHLQKELEDLENKAADIRKRVANGEL